MYSKRLKVIRIENNLLQKDLAKIINVSEITYTHYESEYYIMPLKYLIILSDYFNVSLDYIFEFTSDNKKTHFKNIEFKKMGMRLKEFRKENDIIQDVLAQVLNTNRSVIANYERGRTLIATPFLYTICKTYKISADYLLGRIDNPKYLD